MFIPIRLILCHYRHGVSLGYYHIGVGSVTLIHWLRNWYLRDVRMGAMVQIPTFFFINPVATGYRRQINERHNKVALAMKAIDRHKLIDRISTIEGLTDEERYELLSILRNKKKYGLVWEDKPEAVEERLREELPVLTEVKDRALTDAGPDAPNHILIEGDNLAALTELSYTHAGKIDVIYIDPPYNTGNKDFIYNDSFVDSEDSYRHSKWLSFMSKRLRIAKKLLSDRGVIFISIDDNEISQLKLLCDEIFGFRNFVSQFIWKKKQGGGNDSNRVVIEHEYILCYASGEQAELGLDTKYELDPKLYPFIDEKGEYGLITLDKASIQISQSLIYDIIGPDGKIYRPRIVKGKQSCWRWSKAKVDAQYNELVFKNDKVYTKYYRPKGVIPRSLLVEARFGRTESGNDDIKDIFGNKPFGYPKPVFLLKHILSLGVGLIILDFFAGSGTTLHAVMQLNKDDGGKRQCILCTNNENKICENVTYERNKRVIEGYTKPNGDFVEGLHDNNLRYYRTDFVSRKPTQKNRHELMEKSTNLLCIKENLYEEVDTFGNIKLNSRGARFFDNHNKQMLIIYRPELIPEFVKVIDEMNVTSPIRIYVYSPGRYAYEDEFAIVADKVKLCALPENILEAMSRVLLERDDSEGNAEKKKSEPEVNEENKKTLFGDLELEEQ